MISEYAHILLAIDIWREARGETIQAKVGVASVVRNRVNKPGWWGHNVVEVVTHKWQFTSMTGAGDPNLRLWPLESDPSWLDSLAVAAGILGDPPTADNTDNAVYYHDTSIAKPAAWGVVFRTVQLGHLIFYREA